MSLVGIDVVRRGGVGRLANSLGRRPVPTSRRATSAASTGLSARLRSPTRAGAPAIRVEPRRMPPRPARAKSPWRRDTLVERGRLTASAAVPEW